MALVKQVHYLLILRLPEFSLFREVYILNHLLL